MSRASALEEKPRETSRNSSQPCCPPPPNETRETSFKDAILSELRKQQKIAAPLMIMNLTCFAKIVITMVFLGRLGGLQFAGGTLGFTFANVTGFSVLTGLCGAMEPICGQAFGAKNHRLLHKTLLMATLLLLLASLPISFLWLHVDKILLRFGQHRDISMVAKTYVTYLIPDLVATSFLCPLKAYLSSQCITIPIMCSSALALAFHLPINILLSKAKGIEGVAIAVWATDFIAVILLASYVSVMEWLNRKSWRENRWRDQDLRDWVQFLKLCGPCCLTTCLEWWCYEILILLTGHLKDARKAVAVIAVVINFDYLLFSIMVSIATCVSTRVSNELGANRARSARKAAYVSLALSILMGFIGSSVMISARGPWGSLYSHDDEVLRGVKKMMLLMALIEVFNFPLQVCGGIVRGTARPWLGMYANLGGFYLLALPLGVVLAFKVGLGLAGLLLGYVVGTTACAVFLLLLILKIDWVKESEKAQKLANGELERDGGRDDSASLEAFDSTKDDKQELLII